MVKPLAAVDTVVKVYTGAAYEALYGQRDATLNLTMEVYELKHKTAGRWINRVAGYRDWTIDADALMFMDDDDTWEPTWEFLRTAWAGTTEEARLQLQMSFPGGKTASGYGYMTSMPVGVPEGASTIKATFVGDGALAFA